MGCDIHMFAEKKISGKWQKIGNEFKNDLYDENSEFFSQERFKKKIDEPYRNRNYELFATLADVRNKYGVIPIAFPRGLPKDVSKEIKKLSDDWEGDGHSHSWYTLDEILNHNWEKEINLHGWVALKDFESFKENSYKGCPNSWGKNVGGSIVRKISIDEANRIIENDIKIYNYQNYYVWLEWKVKSKDYCADFLDSMAELGKLGDSDKLRIVFWFDN